jgi:hypothetical protein
MLAIQLAGRVRRYSGNIKHNPADLFISRVVVKIYQY